MRRFAILVAIAACGTPDRGPRWQAAGATEPQRGGTLRIAIGGGIRTLDPTIAYDELTAYALHHLVDTLVDYAPDGVALVPRLAERWDVSPDGLTYHFTLRAGPTFADGSPIVAADFVTALERVRTTAESPFPSFLEDVKAITAPGERDLVIELSRPNAAFLYLLAMPFAGPQRASHNAAAGDEQRRRPLASGPYELASWTEGEQLVLKRRTGYHDATRGFIDTIVLRENVPRDTQFLMFERGELDVVERLAGPDYLWIVEQPAWAPHIRRRPLMNVFGSRMNVRKKPFDDRRVRQALNYAVNKDVTYKLLHGTTVPAHGMLAPGIPGRDDTLAPYPHDPAKARALLAEAGYPDGLDLEYVTVAEEETEKLAQAMQADLAEVGVRMRISIVSFATYLTQVPSRDGPPLSVTSWIADYPDASNFFDARFHSRGIPLEAEGTGTNDSFYANPAVDTLLDTARAAQAPAERARLYQQVERILHEDAPWIWDYHRVAVEVVQPYVRDYDIHPVWIRDYTRAWLDLGPDGERDAR